MSAATEVVLVRHGEAVKEPGDPGLTPAGVQQAERVAAVLAPRRPVAVVSSPLRRARDTAEPLALGAGLRIVVDPRLRERMNWDGGVPAGRFHAEWRRTDEDRDAVPEGLRGARSSAATGRDLLRAVAAHAVAGGTVVLVTHGGAVLDLLRTLLGDRGLALRAPRLAANGVPNASITRLISTDGGPWALAAAPDVRHLPPADGAAPRSAGSASAAVSIRAVPFDGRV